jgi:hypothetical protein
VYFSVNIKRKRERALHLARLEIEYIRKKFYDIRFCVQLKVAIAFISNNLKYEIRDTRNACVPKKS